ncbi:hypothetical protein A9Q99_02200 [Gammaproteobacteria bacterium 45_16_T64]|nr:hypothetical protein A9Q99_02200 [Gammaproteobacteria bacterium 45_16_T64]
MKPTVPKLLLIIALLIVGGCSSLPYDKTSNEIDTRLYQLYIDEYGKLIDPYTKLPVENGTKDITEKSYVDRILENYRLMEADGYELTVFIHGGLNTFASATDRVKEKAELMLKAKKYPLFISWDSSGPTNYWDYLMFLRRGELLSWYKTLLTVPTVIVEDFSRSIARIPASWFNMLDNNSAVAMWKESDEEKDVRWTLYGRIDAEGNVVVPSLEGYGFNIHNHPDDNDLGIADMWSVPNPIKLVTAPIIDGLGTGAWESMLRRTDLVLLRDSGEELTGKSETAVTVLFDNLKRDKEVKEAKMKMEKQSISNEESIPISSEHVHAEEKITIIGHSMGTIVANNIIANYPNLNFERIVYMAGACRIKDIRGVVSPYLKNNPKAQFFNLTLNPYREMTERNYLDFLPRGSLLMWIDDTLGDVNSFQDRTAGTWFNIVRAAVETFPADIRSQVHLTQFGMDDYSPKVHGDFGTFPFWNEIFWTEEYWSNGRKF